MEKCQPDESHILLIHTDPEMIQQIKSTGGNWPAKNETLVKNYVNFFVKFVRSIEIIDLE